GYDLAAAIDAVRAAADDRVAWAAGVQNGIVKDDLLAAAFGAERVVGAATIFGAQRQTDGRVLVSSIGATYLGELATGLSERVERAARALQFAGLPTQARAEMPGVLGTKARSA